MFPATKRFGLSSAIATPFRADGAVDTALLIAHAKDLIQRGCDGITLFGTTGEGPSIAVEERASVIGALKAGGIDPGTRLTVGVMASTLPEALAQARLGLEAGARALLVAPPFYFKGVDEAGTSAWFHAFFAGLGAQARDVILYHIPQFTGVPISVELLGAMKRAYPKATLGVKDSFADWEGTKAFLAAHGDLAILVGAEHHIAAAVKLGGAGTICGYSNIIPEALRTVVHEAADHAAIGKVADVMAGHHFLAALKAVIAHRTGRPDWLRVRPPLLPADAATSAEVARRWDAAFPGGPA